MQHHSPSVGPASGGAADTILLQQAAASDERVFAALFACHRAGLHGFLYGRLGSHEDAEDAVSVTFWKAWRARHTFRGGSSGKSWLYQIATRVALDQARARQRRVEEQPLEAGLETEPESGVSGETGDPAELVLKRELLAQRRAAVVGALQTLPSAERELVRLRYFAECDCQQISARLGIPTRVVRRRLRRVGIQLRGALRELVEAGAPERRPA
jgi:RNA polymerase sigma-70 factor (ECF subfamily)